VWIHKTHHHCSKL